MLKMTQENEEPPSITAPPEQSGDALSNDNQENTSGLWGKILSFFIKPKPDPTIRETIEEFIEGENGESEESSFSDHEKTLLSNVLDLHDMDAGDVMVPRADIIGINHDITQDDLLALLSEKQYSRFPVYQDSLDDIIGSIHIKDILSCIARNEPVVIEQLVREIPVVSPSMDVLDLLLQMRITRKHLVLVVDEFGGIDGLITLGDLLESIVGQIDDEHDLDEHPEIALQTDGTILADARVHLGEFEEKFGEILSEEERLESETLGGLVFFMAGRVPVRGEVLKHRTGMMFEVLEADPRRVRRIRIRNIPQRQDS